MCAENNFRVSSLDNTVERQGNNSLVNEHESVFV